MHSILSRQLRKVGLVDGDPIFESVKIQEFVRFVDRTYKEADQDRYMIERSLDRVSEEMTELYESLKKNSQSDLKKINEFLDSIIENIPAMIVVKNVTDLTFSRFNRAGEILTGLDRNEIIGKTDFDFFPREQAEFFVSKDREVLSARVLLDIPEEPIQTAKGTRWLHTKKIPIFSKSGEPEYLLGISVDITDRKMMEGELRNSHEKLEVRVKERTKELEKQIHERAEIEKSMKDIENKLRHSQKMEAIGRLAGGVAHDFNNILGVILAYAEMMLIDIRESDPLRSQVEEIRVATERGANLTRQLLAFSRQQVLQVKVLDLGEIVTRMRGMLQRLLGEDMKLLIHIDPNPRKIKADPGQIEQVIMNLVLNARDAMPIGGDLSIHVSNIERDSGSGVGEERVLLSVKDTGVGMDEKTVERIFEPFFTTKGVGKGTGLGLATVLGVVEQSQGQIKVVSDLGKGTTFNLFFPATSEESQAPSVDSVESKNIRGTETILLVEDQNQLRDILAMLLRREGYTVIAANGPREAMTLVQGRADIHLLITDVVMPEMGGRLLAQRLGSQTRVMRVLFMSGYTEDDILRYGVEQSSMSFIQKPFSMSVFVRRVREVLDADPTG